MDYPFLAYVLAIDRGNKNNECDRLNYWIFSYTNMLVDIDLYRAFSF